MKNIKEFIILLSQTNLKISQYKYFSWKYWFSYECYSLYLLFLQLTNSKIKDVNGCFEEKNLFNPRGKAFLDQSGQIQIRNKKNQYLFINALRKNSHGINSIYNFENGNIFFSEIDGFCYISMRKKTFYNFPSYRYGMPSKNLFFKYKNNLEEMTTKSLKFFRK